MNKEAADNVRNVVISDLPIELYKVMKIENIVYSGGEAKFMIREGLVSVNGEIETRKRKKIRSGDIITFANEKMRVIAAE